MSGAVVPRTSLELEENAAAFLGGGYFLRFKIPKTTVASSIRSVSTSIVVMRVTPLFWGNNLAVPYQQLHYSIHGFILSINRSSGRFLCICLVFSSYYTQNRHTSRCACFPYITLYPATRCLLPQNQQIGYCTCRDDDDPADKRCCPLELPPEQRQEQPEQKQMIPRFLIREQLPLYRQHHRPVQTRRRFPRPSPPVHGISR